ncbi:hypothetical protein [Chitinimonas naiadis]
MTRYRLLASVRIEHGYYADTWPRGVLLQPVPETVLFLERFGLVVKSDGSQLALIVDEARLPGIWSERDDEAGPRSLRIRLWSSDPHVAFCTDTSDLPQLFEPDAGSPLQLRATASLKMDDRVLEAGLLAELALPLVPPGVSDQAAWITGLGSEYRLRLEARSTVWKYLLIGDWPVPDVRLVDMRNEVLFSVPEAEALPNGTTAWVIRSLSAIRLQERGGQRFQLRSGPPAAERILIGRLPLAAPAGLRHEPVHGQMAAVSEIFINR